MSFLVFLLFNTLQYLVNAELACTKSDNSAIIYHCSEEHECCPEGCCVQPFTVPKISIALGLNVCIFILILCFLCWSIQYLMTLCGKLGLLKPKLEKEAPIEERRGETPPPRYSVAVELPDAPTYEDAVSDTKKLKILILWSFSSVPSDWFVLWNTVKPDYYDSANLLMLKLKF